MAGGAPAVSAVCAYTKDVTIEPVVELLPILYFPGLDGHSVLMPDLS